MTPEDGKTLAEAVAKALGLRYSQGAVVYADYPSTDAHACLLLSGDNLFIPYWQVRCRDWLHANGYLVHSAANGGAVWNDDYASLFTFRGAPAEFCARALAELMKDRP